MAISDRRAIKCRKCGKWFKGPYSMQVLPSGTDPSLCGKCNKELDDNEGTYEDSQ